MTLAQQLRERMAQRNLTETPLFGMREKVLDTVKSEMAKFKSEILAELQNMITENLGEDIITTIAQRVLNEKVGTVEKVKGELKPIYGVDFLTPQELKQIKKELKPKDGIDGKDGVSIVGPAGKDGKDAIDTADELVAKLNTLDEKLDMKVIKGLVKYLQNVAASSKTKGGGGGGGLSLPISQTFTGDGETTSFTLTSQVAAGGRACWVFYNGQYLVPTTHFTVTNSTKTLALTFTPQENEKVDLLYFRT